MGLPQPPQKPKPRVTMVTWFFFGFYCIADGLKFFLLFLNAIPAIGNAFDALMSFFISLFEILGFAGLWFIGFYRKGRASLPNILTTFALAAFDAIPLLDDLPLTAPGVFIMIVLAKKADTTDKKDYEKAMRAYQAQEARLLQARSGTAQLAAERADAMRQQAMQQSIAAANDN